MNNAKLNVTQTKLTCLNRMSGRLAVAGFDRLLHQRSSVYPAFNGARAGGRLETCF